MMMYEGVSQGVKLGGITVDGLVVPCGLERRKLGLGKLGAAQHVEMMAFVSEGHSRASGAADPVELGEGRMVEAAQDVLMIVKGVEFDG